MVKRVPLIGVGFQAAPEPDGAASPGSKVDKSLQEERRCTYWRQSDAEIEPDSARPEPDSYQLDFKGRLADTPHGRLPLLGRYHADADRLRWINLTGG